MVSLVHRCPPHISGGLRLCRVGLTRLLREPHLLGTVAVCGLPDDDSVPQLRHRRGLCIVLESEGRGGPAVLVGESTPHHRE